MKKYLIYQQSSDTIRQMPENYLIASRAHGSWIAEPDLAADKHMAIKVFTLLLDYNNKYEASGTKLLDRINKKWTFKMWITLIYKSKINF